MCRFIESIRVDHGKACHLTSHQKRMDRTAECYYGRSSGINLESLLGAYIHHPEYKYLQEGLYKMRLVYSNQVDEVSFSLYNLPFIGSLQLVEDDAIDYCFKFSDRSHLERLYSRRGKCDDILIVKNGFITDSSYANVAFFDGCNWYTPQNPLLEGTQRAHLLQRYGLILAEITPYNLPQFKQVRLFNAMIRWEDEVNIDVQTIHPLCE